MHTRHDDTIELSDMSTSKPTASGKNLIVCIDSTFNGFGQTTTHVVKLFKAINLESTKKKQLAFYSGGVGSTYTRNADKSIKEAYSWLVEKYEKGDDIFLFGFSRGAYQVRALACMIQEVGLIRTRAKVARAYEVYEAIQPGMPETRVSARKFKNESCWSNLTVRFIGVWDTVSPLGLAGEDASILLSLSTHLIRHALALDECRAKFIPEYFHQASFSDNLDVRHVARSGSSQSGDIKEVWFAGSHVDLGGLDKSGTTHHIGNISLLWMAREAAERGLELRPTNITWGLNEIDLDTGNPMSFRSHFLEYLAVASKHQARLIMPDQKVHASILWTNAYKPVATWGGGLDVSITNETPEDVVLDKDSWEMDLFSNVEAQELIDSLGVPGHLDGLLFMLHSSEGKRRISNVPDWQGKLEKIASDHDAFTGLVAIVAYYEVSCSLQTDLRGPVQTPLASMLGKAKESFSTLLAHRRHLTRTVTLLGLLTRHRDLQDHILTQDVLETFVELVDSATVKEKVLVSGKWENRFVQVMAGLQSLLCCTGTCEFIARKLKENHPKSDVSRVRKVLEVDNSPSLIAALRMVLTLARISTDKTALSSLKPRIAELTKKQTGITGSLSIQIWFALHEPNAQHHLFLRDARFRENLANVLVNTNFDIHQLVGEEGDRTDLGLTSVFGLNTNTLDREQKRLIEELKKAAQQRNSRVHTTMTMILLRLCESLIIRNYLCEIGWVDMLVDQLQYKHSALPAAYALVICLKKYQDMRQTIQNNQLLPKHIVGMLRLNHFDGTIGQVEGLTIFVYLMQYDRLREGVMKHNMMEVLGMKAGKRQLKNILSGLLSGPGNTSTNTQSLVTKSLDFLKNPDWEVQKTGVTILTALAQIPNGEKIIEPHIPEIIQLILPEHYQPLPPDLSPPPAGGDQAQRAVVDTKRHLLEALKMVPKPASGMMGPACTLRNFALKRMCSLQRFIHGMKEYHDLKVIYGFQKLVAEKDTAPWRVHAPNKTDVTTMLEKMTNVIESELLEEDLLWIGDTLPPGVQHWDRAFMFLGYTAVGTALFPVALGASIGFSALTVVALAVGAPIYFSVEAINKIRRSRKPKPRPAPRNAYPLEPR